MSWAEEPETGAAMESVETTGSEFRDPLLRARLSQAYQRISREALKLGVRKEVEKEVKSQTLGQDKHSPPEYVQLSLF